MPPRFWLKLFMYLLYDIYTSTYIKGDVMEGQTEEVVLSQQSPSAIRVVVPRIEEILSIGCGDRMGWGNDCNTRHLCYKCQAILQEFPPNILVETIQHLDALTREVLNTPK